MRLPIPRIVGALCLSAAVFAACGGPGATAPTTPTQATATGALATIAPGSITPGTTGTVSANNASYDELVGALTAAGVPNASRWANEVMEYRPYPADDPTLQRLQDNLAKYNPAPETLAAILSALTP